MRTRREVAGFLNELLAQRKEPVPDKNMRDYRGLPYHWGLCEFRQLMDYLYEGVPNGKDEDITAQLY